MVEISEQNPKNFGHRNFSTGTHIPTKKFKKFLGLEKEYFYCFPPRTFGVLSKLVIKQFLIIISKFGCFLFLDGRNL